MTSTSDDRAKRPLRFIIIGAGLSGIMAAIKLEAAGYRDIVIYEKANKPGGTWRENTYPGIACDIPSHFYSYSFAPNPNWSMRYAPGGEIQRYIEDVMRKFGVDQRIRFNEEIVRCKFSDGRWNIETRNGTRDAADVLIAATGVLHHPSMPEIPGLSTFAGASFHSARWNHDVQLDGRRIGVIGSGSSAVQIVSALVKRSSKLTLFQRTAQWIMPQENLPYSAAELAKFRDDPQAIPTLRDMLKRRFTAQVADAFVNLESPQYKALEQACIANLEANVADPVLRERLRPDYKVACKRLVVSPDFYQAIQQPNAELVTERIDAIEPAGVRTRDGRLHELDVLVLATGFQAHNFLRPIDVIGSDGVRLNDAWSPRPRAYLTVAVPGFPNLFMLNGPHSPVGNYPLIEVAELQMGYILRLVERLRDSGCRALAPSETSTARYDAARIAAAKTSSWATGCSSWYLDAEGVPAAWPWPIDKFYAEMAAPNFDDYERAS
jgi:cation diffusion facilitator CzcD-associated flavoprotein CzcO